MIIIILDDSFLEVASLHFRAKHLFGVDWSDLKSAQSHHTVIRL